MKQIALSIVAENNPGVLSRISGLFSRRGYNIDSITACKTQDEKYSRMTIAVSGDDTILAQIKNQLIKLEDVITLVVEIIEGKCPVSEQCKINTDIELLYFFPSQTGHGVVCHLRTS